MTGGPSSVCLVRAASDGPERDAALLGWMPPEPERPRMAEQEIVVAGAEPTDEEKQWAMFVHLSQFLGFLVPVAGLIAPIVIWQMKKKDSPYIDANGRVVTNWILSAFIYSIICVLLAFIVIGIPLLLALVVFAVVFPIVGGIKANDGEVWSYPMSIRFFGELEL